MQDGTQEGDEAYIISHRGARSRGYKRRERARARARERESLCASVSTYLVCPTSHYVNVCPRERLREPISTYVSVCVVTCLRKALDIPFYRYKEMSSCTRGCSYVLSWPAEKRLEPYTRANVAVGEVP
jgi:hypothetical protein